MKTALRFWLGMAVVGGGALMGSAAAASLSGPVFYGDPPDEHHPWAVHDRNRPQPKVVKPGTFSQPEQAGQPPADAQVLFDGRDLSGWESTKDGSPAKWVVKDGFMEATQTGDIRTKAQLGDCQLHVEWAAPAKPQGHSQERGNSGIFLLGAVEIQVLDCYENATYADGSAGSVYGVNPPLANPLRGPGEFQVYDIVFRRPVYRGQEVVDPGYVTVFINGVLVQDHTPLEGGTGHMGRSKAGPLPAKGPLVLQDHGNPTRYRNIWCRELPPRSCEGGTDGVLSTEATQAKRGEIAAAIRKDAAGLGDASASLPALLRRMESLVYEVDAATLKDVESQAGQYLARTRALPAEQLAGKKDEVKSLSDAFQYLVKWKRVPADFAPAQAALQLIREQGWDKKPRR